MTRRSRFPLTGLALCLLSLLLIVPFLGAPAQADPNDPADPDATVSATAEEVAEEALATVEEIIDGVVPTPADPAPADPADLGVAGEEQAGSKDLTLALRDLALSVEDLSKADQDKARAILARPTDAQTGDDDETSYECYDGGQLFCYQTPEETPFCLDDVCVHYVDGKDHGYDPNRVDNENDGPGGRWPGTDPAVPDYVEFVAATMQAIANRYVKAGYRTPVSDGTAGGNAKFDVYLAELGKAGLYGYCTTDEIVTEHAAAPAYCVLDNNYKRSEYPSLSPAANLKVTAAHEYFHAVQFAYDISEDAWIMEATAAWVEDEVYDPINDNRQYLPYGPLGNPAQSLDRWSGLSQYGSWIFFRFLTERFSEKQGGLPILVRQIWEKLAHQGPGARSMYSVEAIRSALRDRNTDLYTQFASFTAWNRRPRVYYEEGAAYTPAPLQASYGLSAGAPGRTVLFRLDHLAAKHFRFVPRMSGAWKLRMRLNLNSLGAGGFALVTIKPRGRAAVVRKVRLDSAGNALVVYPFGGRVDWIELDAINASAHFSCPPDDLGDPLSTCGGFPKHDNIKQGVIVRAVRG